MILTIHDGEDAIPPRLLVEVVTACLFGRPADITTLSLRFAVNAGGMHGELDAPKGFGEGGQEGKGRLLTIQIFLLHREIYLSIAQHQRLSIEVCRPPPTRSAVVTEHHTYIITCPGLRMTGQDLQRLSQRINVLFVVWQQDGMYHHTQAITADSSLPAGRRTPRRRISSGGLDVRQRRGGRTNGAGEGANAGLSVTAAILCNDRLDLPVELPDGPAEPHGKAEGQQVHQDGVEDEEQLRRRKEV